jgi:KDO2-lipid IV(A) lauroyltransferase
VNLAARALGALGGVVLRRRRRLVTRNLARVCGPELAGAARRRAVRATFQSYARYWLDTFRLRLDSPASLRARVDVEGLQHLDAALARGGAVLAVPHLGSWDLGAAWLAAQGYPLVAVVERLEPPELGRWFAAAREARGIEVILRDGDVWEALERALREGKVVILVCDRDLRGRGVETDFFGERTTLPPGPAALSLRTGAPLLPAALYSPPHGCHRGVIRPPLPAASSGDHEADVAVLTQRLAAEMEELIRHAPDQWHLMQPNWPSDREQAA